MTRIKCPKCLVVNPEGADQCTQCGTPLPRIRITAKDEPTPPPQRAGGREAIQFRRGQVVARRYTVLNLIGRGGMGCIYKVQDNTLGEEVALKTLLPQLARDRTVVERFFNEARIARRLAHPNIVRVHDIGNAGDVIYISMELVRGTSLRGLLEAQPAGQRLPVEQTLRILDQLCAALEYAHQHTVHRDIKPENVMLEDGGRVKLMDFGISKLMADTRLTGASMVMGTPFYMAPEQLRNSRDVDARADLYSCGVMLYEMLTGVMPTGVPKPVTEMLKDVPPMLDELVAKCVDPDPAQRFQTAGELQLKVREVLAIIGGNPVRVAASRAAGSRSPLAGRIAGIAALVLLAVGTAGGLLALEPAPAATPAAPPATPTSPDSDQYASALALMPSLRDEAAALADADSRLRPAVVAGDELAAAAAQARSSGEEAQAAALALDALQCFTAALVWPADMQFVPPGSVQVDGTNYRLPPFLIGTREIRVSEFHDFCDRVARGWDVPPLVSEAASQSEAASGLAFFDALAFAAAKGARLPTRAEWLRAAADAPSSGADSADVSRFGCEAMGGGVSEWTATPERAEADEDAALTATFGDRLWLCGGNDLSARNPLYALPWVFEERSPGVGARIVRDIPRGVDAARATLESAK